MKNYFSRLRKHPGVPVATIITLLIAMAIAQNDSITSMPQALFVGGFASGIVWLLVLVTNFKIKP